MMLIPKLPKQPPELDMEDPHIQSEGNDRFNIPRMSFAREISMVSAVCLGPCLVQAVFAQGILPDLVIAEAFGVSTFDAAWIPAGYALTSGAFMLPAGRFGDLVGHRACFVAACLWFALSSLLAGVSVYSRSFIFFSICRGIQGIGAALLIPCALAILGSIYKPGPRKNIVFSLFAAGNPVGFTLGAVFSGLIAQLYWWPWMFYVTSLVCAGLALVAVLAIPKLPFEYLPKEKRLVDWKKDVDWSGSCTSIVGLLLFNFAWNRAPAVGWSSAECIVTLILGLSLLVAFLMIETRANKPLVPVDKIQAEAVFVLLIMGFGWASFGIFIYYLINFTTSLRGDSLLSTAAQCIPVPFAGLSASLLNSWLLRRGILSTDILAFSMIWFILGNVLVATMPVQQSYWIQAFWIYVAAPFGMDLSFPSATLIMSQLVPIERQGMAASLIATVVYYSQSVGLGVAGTVEANTSNGNVLQGYRNAVYSGIGLAVLALAVSIWATINTRLTRGRAA